MRGAKVRRRQAMLLLFLAAASCAAPTTGQQARSLRVEPDAATPFDDRLPSEPEKSVHEPEAWPFDVQHYDVDIAVDFEHEAIAGTVAMRIVDLEDGVDVLPLHAAGMQVHGIEEASGAAIDYTVEGDRLLLGLPGGSSAGTVRSVVIEYETTPDRGLHFMRAPRGRPEWGTHVWSQGECTDTRWWIPCHDAPDDRATHSMTVTVPLGMTAIAAGELVGREDAGDTTTWSYRMDVPHVSYLMTLVAGDLVTVRDDTRAVPLEYVAAPYEEPHLGYSLRKTPDVLAYFAELTGRPYPYSKYAQCCVRDFVFGGMENISATTLTDSTLHPPEWEPSKQSHGLVAHEAAHQWFGDLITCKDWSHIWLNEGFATYLTLLWQEHDEGREAFLAAIRGTMNGALGACENAKRPVVSNRYAEPFDLFFDGHAYGGGAARLHALRCELGDETFFAAVRLYVERNAGRCVVTEDFEAAVSEVAGKDMKWWFDQWLRAPGRPKVEVSWEWIDAEEVLRFTVKQTHTEKEFPAVYRLGVGVRMTMADGTTTMSARLGVTKREQTFDFGFPSEPTNVRIDHDRGLLARLTVKRSFEDWVDIAQATENSADQLDALAEVGKVARHKKDSPERTLARRLLEERARQDPLPGTRQAAVDEIKRERNDWSHDFLISLASEAADLRVQLAVLNALSEWEDGDDDVQLILRSALAEGGDLVRATALRGLAKQSADGSYDMLLDALEAPGWHSHVKAAALEGFADLGDERAFELLLAHAASDADPWTRDEALSALGRMGAARPEYTEAVLQHLRDHRKPIRRAAANALAQLADPGAVPALMDALAAEGWPGQRTALRSAIVACRKAAVESGDLVTVEAVRGAEIRARHAAIRDAKDEESRAETKRLAAELKTLSVPPLPHPKPAK